MKNSDEVITLLDNTSGRRDMNRQKHVILWGKSDDGPLDALAGR
jgi:hypothetical protein